MDFLQTLTERNAAFATHGFHPELKIIPSRQTMVIGCVDPRVDPMDVLGLEPGEAAIIRNVGGRVNSALVETLTILGTVSAGAGQPIKGWNLIVLHHTQCGIVGCYRHAPGLLSRFLEVPEEKLDASVITDPYRSVAADVATLRANTEVAQRFDVVGMVYDVATGKVEIVDRGAGTAG